MSINSQVSFRNLWDVVCLRDGKEIWRVVQPNIIFNEGLTEILDQFYRGANYNHNLHFGLIDTVGFTSLGATDTALNLSIDGSGSNAWRENISYSDATRAPLIADAAAAQSISNLVVPSTFTMNNVESLHGAFLANISGKGATTGKLIAGAAFATGNQPTQSGDVITITFTSTAASV